MEDKKEKNSQIPRALNKQGNPVLDWVIIVLLAAIVFGMGYLVVQFSQLQDEVSELQYETTEDYSRTNNMDDADGEEMDEMDDDSGDESEDSE